MVRRLLIDEVDAGEINAGGVIVPCRNASDVGVKARRSSEAVATVQWKNIISSENPVCTPFIFLIALCCHKQIRKMIKRVVVILIVVVVVVMVAVVVVVGIVN